MASACGLAVPGGYCTGRVRGDDGVGGGVDNQADAFFAGAEFCGAFVDAFFQRRLGSQALGIAFLDLHEQDAGGGKREPKAEQRKAGEHDRGDKAEAVGLREECRRAGAGVAGAQKVLLAECTELRLDFFLGGIDLLIEDGHRPLELAGTQLFLEFFGALTISLHIHAKGGDQDVGLSVMGDSLKFGNVAGNLRDAILERLFLRIHRRLVLGQGELKRDALQVERGGLQPGERDQAR
jgi:hypothetical protein